MNANRRAGRTVRALALALALLAAGCLTVGRDFDAAPVTRLQIGQTTLREVEQMLGPPWRTGWQDGRRTWTYGHYRYSGFRQVEARDLVLRFDDQGVLVSYDYSSTEQDAAHAPGTAD
jgi:hypothetical protein